MNNKQDNRDQSTLEQLVDSLSGKSRRQADGSYMVQCPCHEDKNPSLHLSRGGDGKILAKCHAGCDQAKVAAALGLTGQTGVYQTEPRRTEFVYRDETGKPVYKVVRIDNPDRPGNKAIWQERYTPNRDNTGGRWERTMEGIEPIPYDLPRLQALIDSGSADMVTVFWPEGEKNAEDVNRLGYPATTHHGGAANTKAIDAVARRLKAVRNWAILVDNDQAGWDCAKAKIEALQRYGVKNIWVAEFPEQGDHGDVSDFIQDIGDLEAAKEGLWARVENAPDAKQWLKRYQDTTRQDNPLNNWRVKFAPIPAAKLAELPPVEVIYAEILKNVVMMTYGDSGVGKTHLVLHDALRIAQYSTVVYVGAETLHGLWGRIDAICRNLGFSHDRLFVVDRAVNLMESAEVSDFVEAVKSLMPAYIVIDTLAASTVGADENAVRDMSVAMAAVRRIATETGATVDIVHHKGKSGLSERGSGSLRAAADVMREMVNEDGVLKIRTSKNRHGPNFAERAFRLEQDGSGAYLVEVDGKIGQDDELTTRQINLLRALAMPVFKDGARVSDLREYLDWRGNGLYNACSILMERKLIVKAGKYDPYKLTDQGKRKLAELDGDYAVVSAADGDQDSVSPGQDVKAHQMRMALPREKRVSPDVSPDENAGADGFSRVSPDQRIEDQKFHLEGQVKRVGRDRGDG